VLKLEFALDIFCVFSTEQENVGFLQKFMPIHRMLIFTSEMFFKKSNFEMCFQVKRAYISGIKISRKIIISSEKDRSTAT
jgi:hypothetical protein